MVVGVEVLFLFAFAVWTIVRAANPEALGTEKPMELAFINAILNSESFPPHDPWLSGFAISYYYFGYVLVAMIAKATSVPGEVAFNLGSSLVFGLSTIGAYGLVYNLLIRQKQDTGSDRLQTKNRFSWIALLGPLFVLIISNLEGFLHMLHNRGLFWVKNVKGEMVSPFWNWLDINDLNIPPIEPYSWIPSRFWWWWRASRVIQDYDLANAPKEIIDEFPFFSFLLADLHPHVLAMPFAFLAMTAALNIFFGGGRGRNDKLQFRLNLRTILWAVILLSLIGFVLFLTGVNSLSFFKGVAGLGLISLGLIVLYHYRHFLRSYRFNTFTRSDLDTITIGTPLHLNLTTILFSALILGAIAFLNTWDAPIYVLLFAAVYAIWVVSNTGKSINAAWVDFLWSGLLLGIGAFILYIPFYLGFSSQAGGIIPNLVYPTRGAHLWVMFAPLLLPILSFLVFLVTRARTKGSIKNSFITSIKVTFTLLFVLWLFTLLLGYAATYIPQVNELYLGSLAALDRADLFPEVFTRRIINPGGWVTLSVLLVLTFGLLLYFYRNQAAEGGEDIELPSAETEPNTLTNPIYFILLLILLGILLVLGPEFVYLRDQFGWRINTIFKFYFQTWLLWAIAAAYGAAYLIKTLRHSWRIIFGVGLTAIIIISLVYPIFSLWSKTNGFQPTQWTLDSTAYFEEGSPDEMAAINWLKSAPKGNVAEAVAPGGGSYTGFGRVSTLSGMPAVLGWVGHETQWRGGRDEIGSRQNDLQRLYCSRDWGEAQQILDLYQIRYVYIGQLERTTYQPEGTACTSGLIENKFRRFLKPVYQQGQVTIYEYARTGIE
jgi:uncharacterized membrane protein